MQNINLESALPIGIREIKTILHKHFGSNIIIKQDPKYKLYDVFMKGKGDLNDSEHCYATIRVGGKDNNLGIQIRGRYKDPEWKGSVIVHPSKGSDKNHVLIKRNGKWADRIIKNINMTFSSCEKKKSQVAYARSKSVKKSIKSDFLSALNDSVSKKSVKKVTAKIPSSSSITKMTFNQITDGAVNGWKCQTWRVSKSEMDTNPCINIQGSIKGKDEIHYLTLIPDQVFNYNKIQEGKTYKVPNLVCKPKISSRGNSYQGCYIPRGLKIKLSE